jgi:hypothetical protein
MAQEKADIDATECRVQAGHFQAVFIWFVPAGEARTERSFGLSRQLKSERAYLAARVAQSPERAAQARQTWLAAGSCIRLRPQHRDHVWSYEFVEGCTHDGRRYRMLNVLDEFTHEYKGARRCGILDLEALSAPSVE